MKPKASTSNYTALLKSNLAQAIKVLYNTRKTTYYPANREYPKLNEALEIFKSNISDLETKGAMITMNFNGSFIYKKLDAARKDNLLNFLDFLLIIPPPKFSIRKIKKNAIINEITVPRLSSILDSLLHFKFPRYWIDKQDEYESIAIAIMEIIEENAENMEVAESIWRINNNIPEKNYEAINNYKNKIKEWLSMGLIL
ncbi:MAG: hypothetical protein M1462_01055 [Candidatus Thermoplasmatota archaeon]|jgi:hypothetical protein|uniref:hypothetical protein n=1 Tax=Ferroplasma sp. TaxID=2591003 RepID=UPI002617F2A0|nr:hypothetical protein [Ferroplasma sp.]MCL4311005.1 hypothetical protein [Candidatus Thermoplasmatota archaeon]